MSRDASRPSPAVIVISDDEAPDVSSHVISNDSRGVNLQTNTPLVASATTTAATTASTTSASAATSVSPQSPFLEFRHIAVSGRDIPILKQCDRSNNEKRATSYRAVRSSAAYSLIQMVARAPHVKCTQMAAATCSCQVPSELHRTYTVSANWCENSSDRKYGHSARVVLCKQPFCDCGGMTSSSGPMCPHLLVLLIRELRVNDTSDIVLQRAFLDTELRAILGLAPYPVNVEKSASKKHAAPPEKRKNPSGEPCGVCFDDMNPATEAIVWCEAKHGCGNNLHKACFDQWAETERSNGHEITCVYCRTPWFGVKQLTAAQKRAKERQEYMSQMSMMYTPMMISMLHDIVGRHQNPFRIVDDDDDDAMSDDTYGGYGSYSGYGEQYMEDYIGSWFH